MKPNRSFLSGLRSTLLQLIAVMAVLKTLIAGVGDVVSQVAETWRNLRSSDDVGAMFSDLRSLGAWAADTLSVWNLVEVALAILAILVTNWLRVLLYVGPRRVFKEAVTKRVRDRVPGTRKLRQRKKDDQNVP